jgi:membrane-bound metal-dependent hydrolase YbcI (DUF457 family)
VPLLSPPGHGRHGGDAPAELLVNGRNHVLSSLVAGLVGVAVVRAPLGGEMIAGTLVCAGFGVWPDVDHHCATVAQTLGPLTRWPCGRLEAAIGHRGPTHSLAFAVASGAAVWALSALWRPALVIVLALAAAWALDLLGPGRLRRRWAPRAVVSIAVALVLARVAEPGPWLGASVALGCVAHLLADLVTCGPIPLAWPARRRWSLGLITTGDAVEAALTPLLAVTAMALCLWGMS